MQNNFWYIYNQFNKLGKWVLKKTQQIFNEKPVEVELPQPKIIDDVNTQATKISLGTQGLLPYKTFMEPLGITDPISSITQRQREDAQIQVEQQKVQEEIQKEQEARQNLEAELQDNSLASGGTPPSTSVLTMEQRAMGIAQQFLAMPVGQSRQQLQALEQQDFTLYSMVRAYMDQERNQMRSQGYAAMKAQNGYNPNG